MKKTKLTENNVPYKGGYFFLGQTPAPDNHAENQIGTKRTSFLKKRKKGV